MTTWTNFAAAQGAASTTWQYNGLGLVESKQYPYPDTGQPNDGGPSYEYTVAGLLYSRGWVRGISTYYYYDHAGALTNIIYPAYTTPCITNFYDRLGRLSQVQVQGCQSVSFTSDLAGNPLSEIWSGGTLDGLTITNGYDQLLRRTNLWSQYSSTPLLQQSFSYDAASRLSTVADISTATPYSANYSYLANSPLVSQITFKQGANTSMTTTKQFDFLNRLTSIASSSSSFSSSFSYLYNNANQRGQATLADGSHWIYQYDKLGQVVSGRKFWADWTPVAGQQFEYAFDDIGNRKSTKAGGDDHGANLRFSTYSGNLLNQYTARDVPGADDIMGAALANSTVSINATDALNNSAPVYRKGEYFRKEVTLDNTNSGPFWEDITVSATGQSNVSGNTFLAKTPERFAYDADGNLFTDGRWIYTWDAENRVTNMEPYNADSLPDAAKLKLVFEYDHLGRRIGKTVYNWVSGDWNPTPLRQTKFVYDGWNLLAELDGMNNSALLRSYLWGFDLSGSLQGAGGVGGLLAVRDQATIGRGPSSHFVAIDANGNVTALVNAADGSLSAAYEYGPFGEVLRATGLMAKANPFRFSTKYQDDESDLVYYGRRYYSASIGKFVSADPGPQVGSALYNIANNEPLTGVDFNGEYTLVFKGTWTRPEISAVNSAFYDAGIKLSGFKKVIKAKLDDLESDYACCPYREEFLKALTKLNAMMDLEWNQLAGGQELTIKKANIAAPAQALFNLVEDPIWVFEVSTSSQGRFFARSALERMVTIFHEASHYAGTEDKNVPDLENAHYLENLFVVPTVTPYENSLVLKYHLTHRCHE
jgi:RHS repeat-associated protein